LSQINPRDNARRIGRTVCPSTEIAKERKYRRPQGSKRLFHSMGNKQNTVQPVVTPLNGEFRLEGPGSS
jgi:hypothetical protein